MKRAKSSPYDSDGDTGLLNDDKINENLAEDQDDSYLTSPSKRLHRIGNDTSLYSSKRRYNNEERHAFRKGAFLIAKQDIVRFPECPIWRVDGPCLLQKYEPLTISDGNQKAFRKTLIFSGWANTTRRNFRPVQVQVLLQVCRTVEVITVTNIFNNPFAMDEKETNVGPQPGIVYSDEKPAINTIVISAQSSLTPKHELMGEGNMSDIPSLTEATTAKLPPIIAENGDIYLQLLLSSAIHSFFLEMVLREGDVYFSIPYKKLEDYNANYVDSLVICSQKLAHDPKYLPLLKQFPDLEVLNEKDVGTHNCFACHNSQQAIDAKHTTVTMHKVRLSGQPYDYNSLKARTNPSIYEEKPLNSDMTEAERTNAELLKHLTQILPSEDIYLCSRCLEHAQIFSKVYHMRYKMFLKCIDQINRIKPQIPDVDATTLLRACLYDQDWKTLLFRDFTETWDQIYLYLTKFKAEMSLANANNAHHININNNSNLLASLGDPSLLLNPSQFFTTGGQQLSAETLSLLAASNNISSISTNIAAPLQISTTPEILDDNLSSLSTGAALLNLAGHNGMSNQVDQNIAGANSFLLEQQQLQRSNLIPSQPTLSQEDKITASVSEAAAQALLNQIDITQLSQQLNGQLPAQLTVNGENGETLNLILMRDEQVSSVAIFARSTRTWKNPIFWGNEVLCYYAPSEETNNISNVISNTEANLLTSVSSDNDNHGSNLIETQLGSEFQEDPPQNLTLDMSQTVMTSETLEITSSL